MIKVLNILDKEKNPSQRDIVDKTGISLGLVNTLIKKCAEKGLVKIKKLNSRNIKYILTPDGVKKITKKTINYIEKAYKEIKKVESKVEELARKHNKEGKNIYILRQKDEIFNLVSNTLNNMRVSYEVINESDIFNENKKGVIYHWNLDLNIDKENLELINIFRS